MSVKDMLITAVVGFAIVFVVLVILMAAIKIMTKVLAAIGIGKAPKTEDAESNAQNQEAEIIREAAPGSCGELVLKDVSERDAAMIMAIVADKMGTPLNELRFKSIRKVEEN